MRSLPGPWVGFLKGFPFFFFFRMTCKLMIYPPVASLPFPLSCLGLESAGDAVTVGTMRASVAALLDLALFWEAHYLRLYHTLTISGVDASDLFHTCAAG